MTYLTRLGAILIASTSLAAPALAQTELSLWYHGAGNEGEKQILAQIVDEFNEILAKLKASGKYEYPLNIGMADKSEWYPYAFLPFLWSTGGDLVDRSTYQTS